MERPAEEYSLAEPCPDHWPTESEAKKRTSNHETVGCLSCIKDFNDGGRQPCSWRSGASLPWLTCLLQAALQRSSHQSLSPKEECDSSGGRHSLLAGAKKGMLTARTGCGPLHPGTLSVTSTKS